MGVPGKIRDRYRMPRTERSRVLVVDDEAGLAEAYGTWLEEDYDVTVVTDGAAALDAIDESVDVVLLDRRMPAVSGDEVLEAIRQQQLDCRVAMVTAIDPEFDVIELGFDAYLIKPVTSKELHETVERLLARADLDQSLKEYYSLVEKQVTLETEKTTAELEASDQYQRLVERIDEYRTRLAGQLQGMANDEDFVATLRDLKSRGH